MTPPAAQQSFTGPAAWRLRIQYLQVPRSLQHLTPHPVNLRLCRFVLSFETGPSMVLSGGYPQGTET